MRKKTLKEFYNFLIDNWYIVYAPCKKDDRILIERVYKENYPFFTKKIPDYPFKKYLFPFKDEYFVYKNNKFKKIKKIIKQVLWGVNLYDLKAITYLNDIFWEDEFYQNYLNNTFIIGHNLISYNKYQFWKIKYSSGFLNEINFDIFFEVKNNKIIPYSGSSQGRDLLERFGVKDYKIVPFLGIKYDEEWDNIKDNLKKQSPNNQIWKNLGEKCVECGKCSIVCPLCYCFDIYDQPSYDPNKGARNKICSTCFYPHFHRIAGDCVNCEKHYLMNETNKKIYFWYYHKFVRALKQHGFVTCVGCGRCTRACVVDINIKDNLKEIKNKTNKIKRSKKNKK
jgi:sulfhydrogenase subunit beta (sulfur reductase)